MTHTTCLGKSTCTGIMLLLAFVPMEGFAQISNRVSITVVKHTGVRIAPGNHPGAIGNVWFVSRDESKKMLTRNGRAFKAKASPDGQIVGWVEGQIENYPDQDKPMIPNVGYPEVPTFFPAAIVLWRNGKMLRIVPEKLYDVAWRFVGNGSRIAVGSVGSHGPTHLQLFDSRTGKVIEDRIDYPKPLPAWTRGVVINDM